MTDRFDVVVVGGGPGGYAAALYGTGVGLKVALVEADRPGGTCLLRGCIPAKAILQTAEVWRHVNSAGDYGVSLENPALDWAASNKRQAKIVERQVKGLSGLLKQKGVTVIDGFGTLVEAGHVEVQTDSGTQSVYGDAVVICSGSVPRSIPGFDFDGRMVISSDTALFLQELPQSCAIIGAGAIGVEFASCFADTGVEVLLLEALDGVLPGADKDVSAHLAKELKRRGVDVRVGARVKSHRPASTEGLETLIFEHGGEEYEADVETILVSVGRGPKTDSMNLAEAGVALDERGFITVDQNMRTSLDGVWAVGDCVPTAALAHVAYAEAMVAIRDILGEDPMPIDYDKVPWGIYCHPEVGFAGFTEKQARDRGYNVRSAKHSYGGNGRALIIDDNRGFVKLVSDADTGVLLGIHVIGPWATEQMVEGYIAINWEATAAELAHFIHPHPTLSEVIGETAMALTGRGLHG